MSDAADPERTALWERLARDIHWFNREHSAWLASSSEGHDKWQGWTVDHLSRIEIGADWQPWATARDASEAPFVRWFCGGLTNAGFNEVDRHVLQVWPASYLVITPAAADALITVVHDSPVGLLWGALFRAHSALRL